METENEQLKREIETLKRENAELRDNINKLKQALDEAVRSTRPKPQPAPRRLKPSNHQTSQSQASGETVDRSYSEQEQKLIKQLSDVQERLTILEQVNAATQRRQLQQEGAYENLLPESVYEKLRFYPAQEQVYARLQRTTYTGCVIVFNNDRCSEKKRSLW